MSPRSSLLATGGGPLAGGYRGVSQCLVILIGNHRAPGRFEPPRHEWRRFSGYACARKRTKLAPEGTHRAHFVRQEETLTQKHCSKHEEQSQETFSLARKHGLYLRPEGRSFTPLSDNLSATATLNSCSSRQSDFDGCETTPPHERIRLRRVSITCAQTS